MSGVVVLVGTRKGLFVARSDDRERTRSSRSGSG